MKEALWCCNRDISHKSHTKCHNNIQLDKYVVSALLEEVVYDVIICTTFHWL